MMDPNDPRIAVARRMGLSPDLAAYMPRYVQIESGGNPNARTGSYSGLLQMGPSEIRRYGGSGLEQGSQMYADRANWFQQKFGRAPSPTELYLVNQQGEGGVAAHMNNPGAPAWQNMARTAEGQQKGEAWAKRAVWGNVPNDLKKNYPGGVDSLTSQQFMDIWKKKVEGTPIPPRPPADVPNQTNAAAQPGGGAQQQAAAGSLPLGSAMTDKGLVSTTPSSIYPGSKLPIQMPVEGGGSTPLPYRDPRAGGGAPPAAAQSVPSAKSLGATMASALAPRGGSAASSYVDPNTGHQIVNPSGSGEQAMGLTRDIGPARPAPAPQRSAAPAAPAMAARPAQGPVPQPSLPPPAPDQPSALPFGGMMDPMTGVQHAPGVGQQDFGSSLLAQGQRRTPGGTPLAPEQAGLLAGDATPKQPTTMQGLPLAPYNGVGMPPPDATPPAPQPMNPQAPIPPSLQAQIPAGLSPFGNLPPPNTNMANLPLWPFATDFASMQQPDVSNDYAFLPY